METATIYRVQTREGLGPYAPDIIGEFETRHSLWGDDPQSVPSYVSDYSETHRPVPVRDNIWPVQAHEYFGFDSPEALASWFLARPEDALVLAEANLIVQAYVVPAGVVRRGQYQVTFPLFASQKLTSFEMLEFAALV